MLWFSTSGRSPKTTSSASGSPLQSGMSTSTDTPGVRARIARITAANSAAPPSGRSSRATAVTTANRSPMRSTASATRSGSIGSVGSGWRVSTRQNPQARVQRSPLIMNVAVPSDQHSDRFGQPASSHTVTRSSSRIVLRMAMTSSVSWTLARIHSGLRLLMSRPSVTPASASRPARRAVVPLSVTGTGAASVERSCRGPRRG